MIYYFSATGNSRHTANRIAQALGDKAVSVLDAPDTIEVDDRLILVYPNYCGGVPYIIADFLKKGKFRISKDAKLILVVTYGNNTGASGSIATKYFKKNTKRTFDAMYSVKMPDNWTPVFDLTNADEVAEINRKADEEINAIIAQIKADASGDFIKDKLGRSMELIYPKFYKTLSRTSHLNVLGSCTGCGLCAENCPVGAIEIKDGKPVWLAKNCNMCLGCLHRCPRFAIQYDNKTQNHGQYQHP